MKHGGKGMGTEVRAGGEVKGRVQVGRVMVVKEWRAGRTEEGSETGEGVGTRRAMREKGGGGTIYGRGGECEQLDRNTRRNRVNMGEGEGGRSKEKCRGDMERMNI